MRIKIKTLLLAMLLGGVGYSQQTITVTVKNTTSKNRAVVKGKAAPHASVILQYAAPRGADLKTMQTDKNGRFEILVDGIREFEQPLVLVQQIVKGTDTVNIKKEITPIVAGDKIPLTQEQIVALLTAHRWKSVAATSRVIIRQTQPKPAFDKLLTFAQKYVRFHPDGSFDFEITHPKQFSYTGGTWKMDGNNHLTIQTDYPHGLLELNNVRINELNGTTLSLLEEVADGLFVTGFVKE